MKTLYWMTRDLRLHDNPALQAAASSDQLLCVFVVDPHWFRPGRYQARPLGARRWHFLWQSLEALDSQLRALGQRLHIAYGEPVETLSVLCRNHGLDHLLTSRQPGTEEAATWSRLQKSLPQVHCIQVETLSLFEEQDLPMALCELPDTFSAFRRKIEKAGLWSQPPLPAVEALPPAPGLPEDARAQCPPVHKQTTLMVQGGENAALSQVQHYLFETDRIATYKETRNALDDDTASSRLSFWLANGCLSARQVAAEIRRYEQERQANESTYWLWFELLWREYFHWYALRHGNGLFRFAGIHDARRRASFYPHRFKAWCEGSTEWPLLNAAMNQLRDTGYLSNRARQIAASGLVNELGIDWRYGAAWFQQQLIDYDVASNWANWQYIAGVGADPRGGRHFNLDKQAAQFDPQGDYVARWRGVAEQVVGLHTVDAADWPIIQPSD
ncbi:MAG: DASH family cryptochrome [Natronospirillum sp.]|uniref:DASH family cryptochrome n=1 Tax=Natronospirillum sp. TaxID=2812955 RepID=UPI0025E063FE|nr:DASH family cryptochrome [Natronospirillum sp.]MCH8552688.1 DASH family cryptochrome [Natronospirillum sp.]